MALSVISCSSSKSNKTNDWGEIVYKHRSGTVAPPYAYSYSINITDAGKGILSYKLPYNDSLNWNYEFTLTDEQRKALSGYIADNNLTSQELNRDKPEKNPIGGSTSYLMIVMKQDPNLDQKPATIEYPSFFVDKDLEKVMKKLYKMLDGYPPKSAWDDISSKRDKYIQENKK